MLFSWVASRVVRRSSDLVKPEEGAKFSDGLTGEVWALISQEAFHWTEDEDPTIQKDFGGFSIGEGCPGEQQGEPAEEACDD